ncbi:MarR family winged helix-turn-helix transcriptional regulator [Paractinoplanes brasiliensis]|uniref:MarR family transcriptional regulator n=1 Tax=Paractinoplanes brasiliensis TaxID=52695 RepID=A0A4R6J891_9ACTN|nr:MarR family winged helix-turn-helix transcriptional regulator [Actinoplanes brasiliensis]TDO31769.1 MarR family transcriptional regulator [Actinoplanes brasiliensis]GID30638.1 MarR family transcriptional regulator [Actinoplanes brasiliensis]
MRGPGQTLFGFVRHWSRRLETGPHGADREQGRLVLVTEAVHALEQRGHAATVNAVADEIGIDQSGASRLIRSGVEAGCLSTSTSADGRRRPTTVTPAGHEMLARAHQWQEQVFDRLTEGWPEQRRRDFQLAMTELMERSDAPPG